MKYLERKKPSDFHLKAFHNLSHATPMDGCKCGPRLQNSNSFMADLHNAAGLEDNWV